MLYSSGQIDISLLITSRRYIYSLLQPSTNVLRKRITFERSEQRADVAKKIKQEAEQLQEFFRKIGGDMADFDSPFKGFRIAYSELLSSEYLREVNFLLRSYTKKNSKIPP